MLFADGRDWIMKAGITILPRQIFFQFVPLAGPDYIEVIYRL